MDDYLANALNSRRKFLEDIIREKKAALEHGGPGGKLRCVDRQGRAEYYWRKDAKNTTGIYIPVKDHGLAVGIAQETYDRMILSYAMEELKCLDQLAKKHQSHNIENVYTSYGFHRKALVNPIWLPDDEYVTNWLQQTYNKKPFKEGEPAFYMNRNEKMRSKTEVLISDILTDLHIPYLYEKPIFLSTWGWVFPDFLALNIRLRKARYWEHYGKMDDPGYSEHNLNKLLAYEKDGIFPGTDLIVTHETSKNPVDTRLLVAVAKHYLL